jgi:hypothetical protein
MTIVYGPQPTEEQQKVYDKARRKRKLGKIVDRGKRASKAMLGITKGKVDRGVQFRNYLAMIDRLSKKRVNLARGFVADPGEKLTATAGRIDTVGRNVPGTSVSMGKILDQYHDRALRLAQAKYYQRQAKT